MISQRYIYPDENKISFLFQDYQTRAIVNARQSSLIVQEDDEEQINRINVVKRGEVSEEEPLHKLINDINGYLRYFQIGVGFIADNYVQKKYEKKEDIYNITIYFR